MPLCRDGQPEMAHPTVVLYVAATTRVPAKTKLEVLATLEGSVTDGMWLVEGCETSSSPVLVARVLVYAEAQQRIPIHILNLKKGDVTLHGGSKVAMASCMDCSEFIQCLAQESHTGSSIPGELEEDLWNPSNAWVTS